MSHLCGIFGCPRWLFVAHAVWFERREVAHATVTAVTGRKWFVPCSARAGYGTSACLRCFHSITETRTAMARPFWRGHYRLALVACPIRLTRPSPAQNKIRFHKLNSKTDKPSAHADDRRGNRETSCPNEDTVMGYGVAQGPLRQGQRGMKSTG